MRNVNRSGKGNLHAAATLPDQKQINSRSEKRRLFEEVLGGVTLQMIENRDL